jgi:hypothetical protein
MVIEPGYSIALYDSDSVDAEDPKSESYKEERELIGRTWV